MVGYRFWLQCSLSMVMALVFVQIGRSQTPRATSLSYYYPANQPAACKVYSLAELGDDPKLCKWIAETIPEMIQPATWKQGDAKLSYYAPSKVLVINNTPTVHAQVDEFLQSLRKTIPQKAAAKIDSQVTPAQFLLQDSSRPAGSVQTGPASYPVPMSPVGPKHLFHFIIRYEGEGIIDANVAKFAKALSQAQAEASSSSYIFPQPQPSPAANCIPAPPPPPPPAFGGTIALQPASGPIAPTNVPSMPTADAPKLPAPPANPGTVRANEEPTAPAANPAEAIAKQLKDRGVIYQKLDRAPDGVRLTCYLAREGGGRFRILETTATDHATAVRAIIKQIDSTP
jgi:hypothetical protein